MNVVILGSSGMIGQGVLRECLHSDQIENILLINRKSAYVNSSKVKEIIHTDFFNFSSLKEDLAGFEHCFYCLGISSLGLTEEEYSHITFDITMAFVSTYLASCPNATICYISGAGTDSTEQGRNMWARVKGKTENALLSMPFKAAYMFRPGYIQPLNGIRSRTSLYQAFYTILKPFYFLFRPITRYVTDTETVGNAMINVARDGYEKKIMESVEINKSGRGT